MLDNAGGFFQMSVPIYASIQMNFTMWRSFQKLQEYREILFQKFVPASYPEKFQLWAKVGI